MARSTMSRDGQRRISINLHFRIGREVIAHALAEADQSNRVPLAEATRGTALTEARRLLADYGYSYWLRGENYDMTPYEERTADLFPELGES